MNAKVPRVAETKPGVATSDHGLVLLDGPNGIAVSMTPDAASGTGESLIAAAERARTHQSDALAVPPGDKPQS